MEHEPRLVARSETRSGTRRVRPEAGTPVQDNARARGPRLDPDEIIRAREEGIASGRRWRVRLGRGLLWWDSVGGYTPLPTDPRNCRCRWDAYDHLLKQRTGDHTWAIEQVPRPGAKARGVAGGVRRGDLSQAWTRSVIRAGRPSPEDEVVHALAGVNAVRRTRWLVVRPAVAAGYAALRDVQLLTWTPWWLTGQVAAVCRSGSAQTRATSVGVR